MSGTLHKSLFQPHLPGSVHGMNGLHEWRFPLMTGSGHVTICLRAQIFTRSPYIF